MWGAGERAGLTWVSQSSCPCSPVGTIAKSSYSLRGLVLSTLVPFRSPSHTLQFCPVLPASCPILPHSLCGPENESLLHTPNAFGPLAFLRLREGMLEGTRWEWSLRNIFCWEPWSKERYYLWEAGLPGHPKSV